MAPSSALFKLSTPPMTLGSSIRHSPTYGAIRSLYERSTCGMKSIISSTNITCTRTCGNSSTNGNSLGRSLPAYYGDSLCLNQGDREEMGQQVRRMGEIYSGAKEVIVWLGSDTASMAWRIDTTDYTKNLPYWRRAWIVQEVALAQRALVTCGNVSVELNKFLHRIPIPLSGGLRVIYYLCNLHRDKRKPLWWILERLVSETESTRAVDKLFGFLGLVSPNEDGSSPIDYIKVDYARRPADVLFDAIFEACPSFAKTRKILQDLETSFGRAEDAYGLRADAQALHGYVLEREISERHFQFASLALSVSEAVRVVVAWLAISSRTWLEVVENMCFDFSRIIANRPISAQYSPSQHAAFVGFSLTLDCEPLHENVDMQGSQIQASPWLCCAHRKCRERPGGESYRHLRGEAMFAFDTRILAQLCAEHSPQSGCDVSSVEFDIPEMNFRMTVLPHWSGSATSGFFVIRMAVG